MAIGRPHCRAVSAGPLVGRVDADLAAESRDRRREIQVVDRRARHDQRIARRIDARRQRPDHVLPVADVHVVVGDDDHLGVHELAQKAPDAEHHALCVSGVLLLHRNDGEPVAAALRRQVEIADLRILPLQQRNEHFVQRHAEHRRLVGRLAGVRRVIDRIATQRDPLDREHRESLDLVVVPGMIAERAFRRVSYPVGSLASGRRKPSSTISADAGTCRSCVRHLTISVRPPRSMPGELVLGQRIGHRCHGAEDRRGIRAERDGNRERRAG